MVEAMQFGIPIVAYRASAAPEILAEGGSLVDALDPPTWLESLSRLSDPAAYTHASEKSATRGQRFTPEAFSSRLAPVLDEYFRIEA